MTRSSFRNIAFGALALPLALGLAACGDKTAEAPVSGEPIAVIAPPAGKVWTDMVEKTPEGGYRMGNPDAPIKLVEYASLTCPHCKHFAETAEPELRTFIDSGRVSWEFRNFILNPLDLTMTMVVRCGQPESFFALMAQTFNSQEEIIQNFQKAPQDQMERAASLPPSERYRAIAQLGGLQEFYGSRGISADQANACLANGAEAEALVKATDTQGKEHNITGTPGFILNGSTLDFNTWPEIKARLETMGAR